jgi:folate-binding protein YgfZ
MTERTILSVAGSDRMGFLQGLVTNDVPTEAGQIKYAALLTPQGKFISDFFMVAADEHVMLDVASSHAPALVQRLSMYRLRADVQIDATSAKVTRGTGTKPDNAVADPRHDALGWRDYSGGSVDDQTDWDAIRVTHLIPETGIELTPDTYILEAGFERLHGINFKKGCYVGQEIAARMKHKTELKKGLVRVEISGDAQTGDAITNDEKPAGTLYTVSGSQGIAYLRFDRSSALKTEKASLRLAD